MLLSTENYILAYGYIQNNIFAMREGVLCLPTQNNLSKEYVSDKQHHFFQVTLPGLQRKTHTMLTSFFFKSVLFTASCKKTNHFCFKILLERDKNYIKMILTGLFGSGVVIEMALHYTSQGVKEEF